MITNERELAVVRNQLALAESALETIHREVKPVNPAMYDLMAEGYIDMITSIRSEIDTYLGIETKALETDASLLISLEGQRVRLGELSAGLVNRFVEGFRRGLQSIVEIAEALDPRGAHAQRWIEETCDLALAGVGPGSVKIYLTEPKDQALFSAERKRTLQQALSLLFDGLEFAGEDAADRQRSLETLDQPTRLKVLNVINRLLPPASGDIEAVSYRQQPREPNVPVRRTRLTRASRERVRRELSRLADEWQLVEVRGVIRSVDLDNQVFVLRERPEGAPDLPCNYEGSLEEDVKASLDCLVLVAGILTINSKNKHQMMDAESLEVIRTLPDPDHESGDQSLETATSGTPNGRTSA